MRWSVIYAGLGCAAVAAVLGAGVVGYAVSVQDREVVVDSAVPMQVAVDFTRDNACTRVSPALDVTGVPEGAELLCLNVLDLTIDHSHGGGCFLPPRGSRINAGAVLGYGGPCAREGEHLYRFRVTARDSLERVIGLSESTVQCCKALLTQE